MDVVLHGFGMITKPILKDRLFDNLPTEIITARYHSWVVDKDSISTDLPIEITAMSEDDRVMAIRHKKYDVRGVQFHPESVLTQVDGEMIGKTMLENWLKG